MLTNEKEGLSIWEVIKLEVLNVGIEVVLYLIMMLIMAVPLVIMIGMNVSGHKEIYEELTYWGGLVVSVLVLRYLVKHIRKKKIRDFKLQVRGKISIKAIVLVIVLTVGYILWYGASIGTLLEDCYLLEMVREAMEKIQQEWVQRPLRAFINMVIMAPICEEILYRGMFLEGLLKRYKSSHAIIISAIIFGIVHINIPQAVNALLIGVLLGIIYYKTKSLILCMILHFTNNLIAYMDMLNMIPDFSLMISFIVGCVLFGGVVFYALKNKETLTFINQYREEQA